MTLSVLATSISFVLVSTAPAEVPPPVVDAATMGPPPSTRSDAALDLEFVRSRAAAVASFILAAGAFGGVIVMQVSRDQSAVGCLRYPGDLPDEPFESDSPVRECGFWTAAIGRTAGAAGLAALSVSMAGVGGLSLGRGDAALGAVVSRAAVDRRVKIGAAVLGAFAGILVTVPSMLRRLSMEYRFTPTGVGLQRAQFVVADVAIAGAAVGAGLLGRAHQYRRHARTLGVAPSMSSRGLGLTIAGRF